MSKTKYNKTELINNILSFNVSCPICGFKYSPEYLNELMGRTLSSINGNITSKILEHNPACIKQYNHSLTVKHCTKCGAEISKRKKSNTCTDCERIENLTRTCENCGKTVVLKDGRASFKYCDECKLKDIEFTNQIENLDRSYEIVRKYFNKDIKNKLFELFFDKFFNKKSQETFPKNSFEYFSLKRDKANDLYNLLNDFQNHLGNAYMKYKWNEKIISNIILCLSNISSGKPGFVTENLAGTISYDKVLPGWVTLLGGQFQNVITSLLEFKFSGCKGKGEFFWSLINKDVQCNYLGKADALYRDKTSGEIKWSKNKTEAGRLLFNRDSWFGKNDPIKWKKELTRYLTNWIMSIPTLQKNEKFVKLVEGIHMHDLDYFNWNNKNGFLYICFNMLKTINNKLANDFVIYMLNVTFNFNKTFKPRFIEEDLTNDKIFKLFHLVNYCLYYIKEDAKSENLDKLIFMSNSKVSVLTKKMLETLSKDELIKLIEDIEIAYPEDGFTKSDQTSHDRNKNRAPGIYFKENKNE